MAWTSVLCLSLTWALRHQLGRPSGSGYQEVWGFPINFCLSPHSLPYSKIFHVPFLSTQTAALTSCQQEAENMENISQSIETICEMQSASVRRGWHDWLGSTSFDQWEKQVRLSLLRSVEESIVVYQAVSCVCWILDVAECVNIWTIEIISSECQYFLCYKILLE